MSPGNLIVSLIGQLEAAGVPCVYLRNHENLPNDVGNDVDLLIQKGTTAKALAIITAEAPKHGWKVLRTLCSSSPWQHYRLQNADHLVTTQDLKVPNPSRYQARHIFNAESRLQIEEWRRVFLQASGTNNTSVAHGPRKHCQRLGYL